MGNLNQFYFMGRLAKAPELRDDEAEGRVATLAVAPGTSGRRGRGLAFVAYGPQASIAESLRVGQALVLRGQLRQEGEGAGALVARVQAIQVLAEEQPRAGAPGEGEAPRSTKRRRRRGRGRKPSEGGDGESPAAAEGAGEGEAAAGDGAAPEPKPRPEPKPLPPPTPVAKPVDPAPPPAGDVKADMPF